MGDDVECAGTFVAPGAAPPPAVAIRGLVKRFDGKTAVAGIDLDVPAGSFFGLVGRNGAGKSTTIKMATGLLRPDAGQAWIAGIPVWPNASAAKALIGVLPEDPTSFDRLSTIELLEYHGLLRGLSASEVGQRAAELLHVLDLSSATGVAALDLSTGMRKKLGLACALIHAPRVLFLDEPFESVDPVSARTIQDVLTRVTATGGTVVFSSHVMDTVERLCDRVAIVHEGKICAVGSIDEATAGRTKRLEDVFLALVGGTAAGSDGSLGWLASSSV